MNLEKAIININRSLTKKQPVSFNSVWIKYRCKVSYIFIIQNIKTEFNDPDWDYVVSQLERCNQKLWLKTRRKNKKDIPIYSDKDELEVILKSIIVNYIHSWLAKIKTINVYVTGLVLGWYVSPKKAIYWRRIRLLFC